MLLWKNKMSEIASKPQLYLLSGYITITCKFFFFTILLWHLTIRSQEKTYGWWVPRFLSLSRTWQDVTALIWTIFSSGFKIFLLASPFFTEHGIATGLFRHLSVTLRVDAIPCITCKFSCSTPLKLIMLFWFSCKICNHTKKTSFCWSFVCERYSFLFKDKMHK